MYLFMEATLAQKKNPRPYVTAFSSITNPNTNQLESFSLNCPHVTDASKDDVQIEVTWTLNEAIWLKIVNGVRRIDNKLTTYNKKTIAGKNVLRISENLGRYWFEYDELTGDFSMEIRPVLAEEDAGVWQCHVTIFQEGNTHTLTSRSRVKAYHKHRLHGQHHHHHPARQHQKRPLPPSSDELLTYFTQAPKLKIFNRPNSELVHISRDDSNSPMMVVFDRRVQQPSIKKSNQHLFGGYNDAVIDYELNMDEETSDSPNRIRSAFSNSATMENEPTSIILLFLWFFFRLYR